MLTLGQGCPDGTTGGGGDGGGTTLQAGGLPAENQRVAIQSQCAQNVITCTVKFPDAVINVAARPSQTVTPTATGFLVQGTDGNGVEPVHLIGSGSLASEDGSSNTIFYSWSYGASDTNPLTLNPGTQFSTQADPLVLMKTGFHHIRLTVRNDIFREELSGPGGVVATNTFLYDFLEIVIEVRD
jgi:hypothetical protein